MHGLAPEQFLGVRVDQITARAIYVPLRAILRNHAFCVSGIAGREHDPVFLPCNQNRRAGHFGFGKHQRLGQERCDGRHGNAGDRACREIQFAD